jgi:hypothetical protein
MFIVKLRRHRFVSANSMSFRLTRVHLAAVAARRFNLSYNIRRGPHKLTDGLWNGFSFRAKG